MKHATTVQVKNNRVILPSGKKLKLFRSNQDGTITFNPLFKQLNNKLQWTEQFGLGEPSCNERQVMLPDFNLTRLRTTWFDRNNLANIVGIVSGGPYEVLYPNYWAASTRYNDLNYFYEWKADRPTKVKFVSEQVDDRLLPMTTVDGDLTIYEGTYGTFETWDYWNVSVCADPPTEVLVNITVRPATDLEDRRLPYTDYLYFEYQCERYKFAVAEIIYSPDSAFVGLVVVSDELKEAEAKLKKTLFTLGCKLELVPIVDPIATSLGTSSERSWNLIRPQAAAYSVSDQSQYLIAAEYETEPLDVPPTMRLVSFFDAVFYFGIPMIWYYEGGGYVNVATQIVVNLTYITSQPEELAGLTEWRIFKTSIVRLTLDGIMQGGGYPFDKPIVTSGPGLTRRVTTQAVLFPVNFRNVSVASIRGSAATNSNGRAWAFQQVEVKITATYEQGRRLSGTVVG